MGNKSSSRNKERNPSKKSKRGSFCLLTNSNGRRRKAIRVRAGGRICPHSTTTTATTGRDARAAEVEQRDYGAARRGVAERRIQASTSRAREGPALARRGLVPGRAARRGLVPGRARFGISRGVCCASACAAWGGWRVDRSQPPSDGRSPRPRLPPPHLTSLASPANVHAATSTHRGVFTSPALLPAAGCRGERPSSRHVAPQ